jgi:hypothetical protein
LKCLIVFPPGDKHIIAGRRYLWINGIGGGTITQVYLLSKCNTIIIASPKYDLLRGPDGVDERKYLNMSSFCLSFNQPLHPLACYAVELCSVRWVWNTASKVIATSSSGKL